MIIESLTMKNFKSYRDAKIEFKTGISIIMGGNGAGKSSILEAVSFALFKQHSGKKIEQLIRFSQSKNVQNKMSVELIFTSNGRKYRVLRQRSKNSSKAKIEINEGEIFQNLSTGDKQVTEEVQSLLEMDGDLFLNAVYIRQGEIANLVDKTPAEKKQVIGKLLGIESLEKAWKNMLPLMNSYEMQKTRLEGKLESLEGLNDEIKSKKAENGIIHQKIEKLAMDIKNTEEELINLIKAKDSLDEDRSIFEKAVNSIESKKNFLEKLKRDHNNLDNQIKEIEIKENELEIIKPKLSKLEVLKKLKESLDNLRILQNNKNQLFNVLNKIDEYKHILEENKKFFLEYSNLSNKITDLESKRGIFEGSRTLMRQNQDRREKTIKKMDLSHKKFVKTITDYNNSLETEFSLVEELDSYLKSVIPEIAQRVDVLTDSINTIEKELSNLKTKNKALIKPITELENVKDKCPVCKSSIDSNKRKELIYDYESQIQLNENRSSQLNREIEIIKSEKTILEVHLSKIHSVNIELLMEQQKNLEDGQKEFINLKVTSNDLKDKVSALDQIDTELTGKKTALNEIKPNYEKYLVAEGSLNSLGNPQELDLELKSLEWDEDIIKEQISSLIEVTSGSVEDLEYEIKYLEELSRKYQQLSGAIGQKVYLLNRIKEVDENLDEVRTQLEKLDQEVVEVAYNEEFHLKIKRDWEIKNSELSDLNGKKQELLGKESGLDRSIGELKKKFELYKTFQKEIKNLKDFIKLLNHIRDIYGKDGVQKDLRNISRPLIEHNTREFFEKFNFEYSDIKLDDDYDVIVYGPAGESNLDMISGGEKIAVALALRLGITQTLSGGNLELIMLDEPTIHLDSYRRQELIELLKRMSIIPQMIIVTHDPDLEEAADNILRVKKIEGESIISNS